MFNWQAPAKEAMSMAAEDASASSQPVRWITHIVRISKLTIERQVTESDKTSEAYLKALAMLQELSDKDRATNNKSARSTRSASQKVFAIMHGTGTCS